jgi:hypothetical protein
MRSFLSAMVLAASFALLVPDNGAQAVSAADAFRLGGGTSAAQSLPADPLARGSERNHETPMDSDAAILLALGFLGAVMTRRLRPD